METPIPTKQINRLLGQSAGAKGRKTTCLWDLQGARNGRAAQPAALTEPLFDGSSAEDQPPASSLIKPQSHSAVHMLATWLNYFRETSYMSPQAHVNKMKKFQIYSCCLRILSPSSGRIKRTSKQPGFQLSQCDHPRDAGIFL